MDYTTNTTKKLEEIKTKEYNMIKCKNCGGTIRHEITLSNVPIDDNFKELYDHKDVVTSDSSYICENCGKEYDYDELHNES